MRVLAFNNPEKTRFATSHETWDDVHTFIHEFCLGYHREKPEIRFLDIRKLNWTTLQSLIPHINNVFVNEEVDRSQRTRSFAELWKYSTLEPKYIQE